VLLLPYFAVTAGSQASSRGLPHKDLSFLICLVSEKIRIGSACELLYHLLVSSEFSREPLGADAWRESGR
jgi:hypothetical protein